MKKDFIKTGVAIVLGLLFISFVLGMTSCKSRSYVAACHMSDFIRSLGDNLKDSASLELYNELYHLNLQDSNVVKKPVKLDKYIYCY